MPSPKSAHRLSASSLARLVGVHPALVAVIRRAAEQGAVPFLVVEGLRTPLRQRQLIQAGLSRTFDSRHLDGHAVDLAALVDGQPRWDWEVFRRLAESVKRASAELGTPIEWGGDDPGDRQLHHFQLPWGPYPARPAAGPEPAPAGRAGD